MRLKIYFLKGLWDWLKKKNDMIEDIFFDEIVRLIEKENNEIGFIIFGVILRDKLKKEVIWLIIYWLNKLRLIWLSNLFYDRYWRLENEDNMIEIGK